MFLVVSGGLDAMFVKLAWYRDAPRVLVGLRHNISDIFLKRYFEFRECALFCSLEDEVMRAPPVGVAVFPHAFDGAFRCFLIQINFEKEASWPL
jgi:hypothetical protein